MGSDPVTRSTWLSLMAYCADQETGGTILKCEGWGDRKWMQLCGVTRAEAWRDSDLFERSGQSLKVKFYPKKKEQEVKKRRDIARNAGKVSGAKRSKKVNTDEHDVQHQCANGKRKEREGNKKRNPPKPPKGVDAGRLVFWQRLIDADERLWDLSYESYSRIRFAHPKLPESQAVPAILASLASIPEEEFRFTTGLVNKVWQRLEGEAAAEQRKQAPMSKDAMCGLTE